MLVGPRQAGKTTLALAVGVERNALYLDLESPSDVAKLVDPELYLGEHLDRLVILDEVHRAPGLFPTLRGLIDRARREGRGPGRYLLLGSASLDLLQQSGETLAGRVSYLELGPLDVLEVGGAAGVEGPAPEAGAACGPPAVDDLWVRGGFPESYLASTDASSLRWRVDFIRSYLERDIPQFGRRIAAETLRRFWVMLAHHQAGLLNLAQLARNLGIDAKTAGAYVDLMVDLLLVRRLQPWHVNAGKRLVRSPKVFVRDSGLVHALLGIGDKEALLGHPVVGASWEGFVVEQLLAVAPDGTEGSFYRTSGGAEIDLLLRFGDGRLWAVEVKRSLAPRPEKGFHVACADLAPERRFVVYPGRETYPVGNGTLAVPLASLAELVAGAGS